MTEETPKRPSQVERQVGTLVAAGFSNSQIGIRLGITTRAVEMNRAKPHVQTLILEKAEQGITPRDRLETLLLSPDENISLRAAVELEKLNLAAQAQPARATSGGGRDFILTPQGERLLSETGTSDPDEEDADAHTAREDHADARS
jgi:hypothetical protein